MPVDDHVIGVVRLHRVLGIAQTKADAAVAGLCLGVGALHHGLGPVHSRDPKAEIVHQMRNNTSAAGEIERGPIVAGAQVPKEQLVPGDPFFLRKNLMTGRLVEGGGPFGPVCLDLGAQVIVRQSFGIAHRQVPGLRRAGKVTSWNSSKR